MFGSKVIDEPEMNKERAVRFYSDEKDQAKPMYQVQRPGRIDASIPWGRSFGSSTVFPEDHKSWQKRMLDPGSHVVLIWNRAFLAACLVALFIDPLFFYLPLIEHETDYSSCVKMDRRLNIIFTCVRSLVDLFYILHIIVKFHTAFVAPTSRVFGRGELVMDPKEIGRRYMRSEFFIDFAAALPVPQIIIWLVMPAIRNHDANYKNTALALIILIQYMLRLYLIFLLRNQIIKAAGVVTKTGWAGAAYNLLLFMLASHVIGAVWYLLSISRQIACWKSECQKENRSMNGTCDLNFLYCDISKWRDRKPWAKGTKVFSNCDVNNTSITFKYGIFTNALQNDVVSTKFIKKYFYCLWWGLQNLSSNAQNLKPSTFIVETTFAILIVIIGLVLFALLIGNMQRYLQSITKRVEEWRLKRRDTKEWMTHRQLPHELRERVGQFVQYKWLVTRGVDEDSILRALPADLHRDIRRHLSLDLVRRVPLFSEMDDQLLDAICLRLVCCLSTEGTCIAREGDPVTEMLFIIRGRLESSTTDGGRTGFFNSTILRPGDFCGEELLTWALLPKSNVNLPSSTRTVRALVEVEAFVLRADDLKFVANQFKRLHSKELQHTFRFHSHHWRTWAACFIQAAWHRYKRRNMAFSSMPDERETNESGQEDEYFSGGSVNPSHPLALKSSSSKLAASFRKSVKAIDMPTKFLKPSEPDFSADPYI